MKTRAARYPVPLMLLLLIAAACVTINLYFPEQEIKDLAGGRYQVNIYARSGSDTQPATLNDWIDIVADKENLRDFELPSGKLT